MVWVWSPDYCHIGFHWFSSKHNLALHVQTRIWPFDPVSFLLLFVFVFLLRQFSLSISQTLPVCPPSSCQRGPLMLLLTSRQTSSRTFFWSSTRFGSSDGSFLAGSVKLSPQSFVVWLPSFHCGLQARFFLLQSVIFFLPGFIPLRKFSLFFCSAGFWSVWGSQRDCPSFYWDSGSHCPRVFVSVSVQVFVESVWSLCFY